jgi:hypothetical protein
MAEVSSDRNLRILFLVAQIALVAGVALGLRSWWESVGHIGDASFLTPASRSGATHAWYHVFREICGDVAKMTVFLGLFLGPRSWRTPLTWWIVLVLMLGYYAPFWIGEPFLDALKAPSARANMVHLRMAIPAFLGLALAWPEFHRKTPA